jgi:hypothetical protein
MPISTILSIITSTKLCSYKRFPVEVVRIEIQPYLFCPSLAQFYEVASFQRKFFASLPKGIHKAPCSWGYISQGKGGFY